MALFEVSARASLGTVEAWRRLTDWPSHADLVPMTTIRDATPTPSDVGTVFVARTQVGPVGFDDPMEITEWAPPAVDGDAGFCRLEKRGSVMTGWAELTVTPEPGGGSVAIWREDIHVWKLPGLFDRPTVFSSKLLFGRVLRHLVRPDG
jgi:hypothetical protein